MAKIVNTFEEGLIKISNKTKQPKNSYSYALNTVPNDEITDRTSRVNERGFDEYISLKEEPYNIIGHQWLGDEQYVFFIKDLEGHTAPFNEIWYVDIKEGIKELKYSNLGLNFKEAYPITSTYRTDYRNHRIIYWVDGLNDDRVIDIDNPDVLSLDLSMISMNSSEIKPDISVESEDSGGAVKSGQYFVAVAYKDDANYVTGASNFSKPISISNDRYFNNIPVEQIVGLEYVQTNGIEPDVVTSKKLVINISNIDQKYDKLLIYIIQVTDTDTKIYTTNTLSITTDNLTYEFTGLNIEEDTTITINDLVVPRINYYASNIINQKENRLIRGNSKIKENLINYQNIANNIEVTYEVEEELIYDNYIMYDVTGEDSPNPNPLFQFANLSAYGASPEYLSQTGNSLEVSSKTFMRDEVYALGISFELNDGTETNVFHIPGRLPNSIPSSYSGPNLLGEYNLAFTSGNAANWDTQIVDGEERWLSRNTAAKRSGTSSPDVPNFLSYWRSDETYPEDFGYPTDGEQDINGKSYVRHHKMPSDVLEPIIRTESVFEDRSVNYKTYRRNIKLVFNNITIPNEYSNIISKIRLHYVPRNDSNKSIVSKGLFYAASAHSTATAGSGWKPSPYFNMVRDGVSVYQFLSPDVDFRFKQFPISSLKMKSGAVLKGYINYFGEWNPSGGLIGYLVNLVNNYQYELNEGNPPHTELLVGTSLYAENAIPDVEIYSRNVDNIQFIDANSTGSIGGIDGNYVFTGESNTTLLRFSNFEDLEIIPSNYPNLNFNNPSEAGVYFENVNYQALITSGSAGVKTLSDIYYDSVVYGSLIRENSRQYGNPSNLVYSDLGTSIINNNNIFNNIEVKNGDCFIDIHYTKKGYSTINPYPEYESRRRSSSGFVITDNIGEIKTNSYIAYYVETDLNIRMRNSDPELPDNQRDYFPLSPVNNSQSTISISRPEYNSFEIKSTGDEYFNIYPFYNQNSIKDFFANNKLISDFNSQTSNKYENRLVYSDKQNYEDKIDSFRITRANNYKDLPMDKGQITQSFIKDDKFFVLTRDALFNVYASNKTIQSIDNDNIVVGTGEFFGLEPVELISIKGGFGGTSSKYSLSESPYGYLFIDRLKSKAILFNETLKDINAGGLNEDYTLRMYNQFKELELEDKFDNPVLGPGITSIYDPRLHRLIITKKDYLALEEITDNYKGLFDPDIEYTVGDIVAKDGVLVEITDRVETFNPKWIGSDGSCVQVEGYNTGMYFYSTLVKVSDDVNEYPLDINNVRTSVSGLPQDSKSNLDSDSNYIPPFENLGECPVTVTLTIDNEDTDLGDNFRLFVDTDVEVWLNSTLIHTVRSTEVWSIPVSVGDNIQIVQISDTENNPWPPDSTASLNVERNGNLLYNNSVTVQSDTLSSYSFTINTPGVYYVKSLGTSTAIGYRKYTTDCNRIGGDGVVLLGHQLTDNTTSLVCSEKGSNVGLAEYNTVDDSGTLTIRTENQHPSYSFDVEIAGTTTRNFTIGPSSNHIENNVPKGNLIITSTLV